MKRRLTEITIVILGILIGALTNVATGALPDMLPTDWKQYLWLSWIPLGIAAVVVVVLEWRASRDEPIQASVTSMDAVQDEKAMSSLRTINTQGGDYAEGNIDKRQSVVVSGGIVYGPVIGQMPPQSTQRSAETSLRRNHPPRIRLIPHLQQPVHGDHDKWASVIVVNEEVPDLIDCRGMLKEVVCVPVDANTTEVVSDTPRPLAWSKSGLPTPNGLATIRCGESQTLDVARTYKAENVIRFTTLIQGDWNPQPPGRYRIRVSVGGKLEGTSFPPLIIECLLVYGGGANLTILSAT